MTCVVNIEDTVTVHEAVAEALSMLVTLITAVPGDTAVTTPDWLTVATEVLLLLHVTLFSVAPDGNIVAARLNVSPGTSEAEL